MEKVKETKYGTTTTFRVEKTLQLDDFTSRGWNPEYFEALGGGYSVVELDNGEIAELESFSTIIGRWDPVTYKAITWEPAETE